MNTRSILRLRLRACWISLLLPAVACVGEVAAEPGRHAECELFDVSLTDDGVIVAASARHESEAIELRVQSHRNDTVPTRAGNLAGEIHEFIVDVAPDDGLTGRLFFTLPADQVRMETPDGQLREITPQGGSVMLPASLLRTGTNRVHTSVPGLAARHFYLSRRLAFAGRPVSFPLRLLGRPWTGRISLHDSHGCELAAREVHLASDPAQSRIGPK